MVTPRELEKMVDAETMGLIATRKVPDGQRSVYKAPAPGKKLQVKLKAVQMPSERFVLSVYEGAHQSSLSLKIDAERRTSMQTLARSVPLVRIDFGENQRHTNPDGTVINGPHVHFATDMAQGSVAFPLRGQEIIVPAGCDDIPSYFEAFRKYCNIADDLVIEWSLGV